MKPVEQEYLLDDPEGGSCYRAAIASIFELPRRAVPHFCSDYVDDGQPSIEGWDTDGWITALCLWAWMLGYDVEFYEEAEEWNWEEVAFGYVVAGGPSPRDPDDTLHAVVWGPDGLVHDPHPSKDGLAGDPVDFTAFIERTDGL